MKYTQVIKILYFKIKSSLYFGFMSKILVSTSKIKLYRYKDIFLLQYKICTNNLI